MAGLGLCKACGMGLRGWRRDQQEGPWGPRGGLGPGLREQTGHCTCALHTRPCAPQRARKGLERGATDLLWISGR